MRRSLFGLFLLGLLALVVSSAMAAAPTPTGVTASPSRVSFGRIPVGDVGTQTVTYTNNTGETVTLQNGYSADDPFSRVLTTPTLLAGDSCTVTLTFSPVSSGHFKGTVWLVFNNASNVSYTSTVAVSGGAYMPKGGF